MAISGRPDATEHGAYYLKYISLVPEEDICAAFEAQTADTANLLASVDEAKAGHRYEPGKWSIKEVIGHIADAERVFAYRMLCIARGETKPLPGFDQDEFMSKANFDARPFADVVREWQTARQSTVAMLRGLDDAAWTRLGVASEQPASARAVAYTALGHERHHLNVLRERYL